MSSKLPGKVFSSHAKPQDRPSVSSKFPGRVFTSHSKPKWKWADYTVPTEKTPLSVRCPGMIFLSEARYKQDSKAAVPKRFQPVLSLTCVVHDSLGTSSEKLMFMCCICKLLVDNSHVQLKLHAELSHGLFTCKNAYCVATFQSSSAHDIHSSVHIRKVQRCDKCSKEFAYRFALQRHMDLHATQRAHKCKLLLSASRFERTCCYCSCSRCVSVSVLFLQRKVTKGSEAILLGTQRTCSQM